jgi:ABC-type transport system substrate-binding protein
MATSSLPNLYSLSLNPNKNILLSDKNIRLALAASIDKNLIIKNIFDDKAEIANSNLPFYKDDINQIDNKNSFDISLAKSYLEKYSKAKSAKPLIKNSTSTATSSNFASSTNKTGVNDDSDTIKSLGTINISTVDTDELKSVADIVKRNWENLGFTVNIKVYELSDLSSNVIKNRDFDVLLFGSIIEKDTDLFAY